MKNQPTEKKIKFKVPVSWGVIEVSTWREVLTCYLSYTNYCLAKNPSDQFLERDKEAYTEMLDLAREDDLKAKRFVEIKQNSPHFEVKEIVQKIKDENAWD